MHGFPETLELSPLVNRTLDSVGFAAFSIYLHFDGGHRITVEGRLGHRLKPEEDLVWDVIPVDDSRLMRLVGQTVATWWRKDERRMHIDFAEGGRLELVDDSPAYESVQFLIGGRETFV